MAIAEVLAIGTSVPGNSSDVVLAAGSSLSVCLKDAAGPTVGAGARVDILRKGDNGEYFLVDSMTRAKPGVIVQGEGTYRFSRVSDVSCGVFSG